MLNKLLEKEKKGKKLLENRLLLKNKQKNVEKKWQKKLLVGLLVDLLARLCDAPSLGWSIGADGVLTMVGDLQRIASHHGLEGRLRRVARRYALRAALDSAEQFMPGTQVMLDPS